MLLCGLLPRLPLLKSLDFTGIEDEGGSVLGCLGAARQLYWAWLSLRGAVWPCEHVEGHCWESLARTPAPAAGGEELLLLLLLPPPPPPP